MESAASAPQPVSNQSSPGAPVVGKPVPAKKKGWKVVLIITVVLIVLLVLLSIVFSPKNPTQETQQKTGRQGAAQATPEPTLGAIRGASVALPDVVSQQLIYVKQTGEESSDEKKWPLLTVYAYDPNSGEKVSLFSVGGKDNYPMQLTLFPIRKQILVNLGHSLLLYDGDSGAISSLYSGDSKSDFITGNALSRDNMLLAFNVTTGMHVPASEQKDSVHIVNLVTKEQSLILEQERANTGDLFSGWLSPVFWTPDNKAIVMNYVTDPPAAAGMAEIAVNGTNLHTLPGLTTAGFVSNDRAYYAYTQLSQTPTAWACQDNGMTSVQLYNTQTGAETTIAADPISSFRVIAWSPDNRQFLYQTQKYQSGDGCAAQFFDKQYFLYDLTTKQSVELSSIDVQMTQWNSGIAMQYTSDASYTSLIVNRRVLDTVENGQQLFDLGVVSP
jgi:hypothetical protein